MDSHSITSTTTNHHFSRPLIPQAGSCLPLMPLLLDFARMAPTSEIVVSESSLVNNITDLPIIPPSLYFDIQGINLPTWPTNPLAIDIAEADFSYDDSSVSLSQLPVKPRNHVYLIDINRLRSSAFTTTRTRGKSLKDLLQASSIHKFYLDVSESSGALFRALRCCA